MTQTEIVRGHRGSRRLALAGVAGVAVTVVAAVVLGAAMFILFMVALIRLVDVYLPVGPIGRRVWIVDAGASAILLALGTFLWRKRRPKSA